MDTNRKIKILQRFYTGVLADTILQLGNEGILEKVALRKRTEQLANGKARAQQLGIESTEQVFEVLPEIFECANWSIQKTSAGFYAQATSCMLCAMAKKLNAQSPCNMYCLDPMEGLIKGIDPQAEYIVESTMWNNPVCRVSVNRITERSQ